MPDARGWSAKREGVRHRTLRLGREWHGRKSAPGLKRVTPRSALPQKKKKHSRPDTTAAHTPTSVHTPSVSLNHSLTHTHLLTCSFSCSLTYSLTRALIYSLSQSLTHSLLLSLSHTLFLSFSRSLFLTVIHSRSAQHKSRVTGVRETIVVTVSQNCQQGRRVHLRATLFCSSGRSPAVSSRSSWTRSSLRLLTRRLHLPLLLFDSCFWRRPSHWWRRRWLLTLPISPRCSPPAVFLQCSSLGGICHASLDCDTTDSGCNGREWKENIFVFLHCRFTSWCVNSHTGLCDPVHATACCRDTQTLVTSLTRTEMRGEATLPESTSVRFLQVSPLQIHILVRATVVHAIPQTPGWLLPRKGPANLSEVGVFFFFGIFAASNLPMIDTVMGHVNVHKDCHLTSCHASLYVSSGEPTLAADVCQSASRTRRNSGDAVARHITRNTQHHTRTYQHQQLARKQGDGP